MTSVLGKGFGSCLGAVNEKTCAIVTTEETSGQRKLEAGCLDPSGGSVLQYAETVDKPNTTQGCTDATATTLEGNTVMVSPAYNIDNLLFKHMIPSIYRVEGSVINAFYAGKLQMFTLEASEASSPDSAMAEAPEGFQNVLFSGGFQVQFNNDLSKMRVIRGPFTNPNGPIGATSILTPEDSFLFAFYNIELEGVDAEFAVSLSVVSAIVREGSPACSMVAVPVSRSTALANVLILLVPALVIGLRMLMRRGRQGDLALF